MYNFFVAFMGVFFSGQATAQMFQFSTSECFSCRLSRGRPLIVVSRHYQGEELGQLHLLAPRSAADGERNY